VWFESGVSHYAVLLHNSELAFPADLYLEGKDQHRGWFQSSLLTAMVLEKTPPMRAIVTHGFTVDAQGRKMSKSLGNVLAPHDIIKQIGTDGLRLWASSIDLSSEAAVSDLLLRNVAEVHRKIRNTCRFLLSNLYDYNHETDAICHTQLLPIDRYALHSIAELNRRVIEQYERYEYTAIFHTLADYCTVDLSAFYLDIVKDRLYVEKADGVARRSAQTACWYIVDTMTRLMAPIISFGAEQISDHYQKNKKQSIHLQDFAQLDAQFNIDHALHAQWQLMRDVRAALLKTVEPLREQGIIKHPLEVSATLFFDASLQKNLQPLFDDIERRGFDGVEFLKEFFIASQVKIADSQAGLTAGDVDGLFYTVAHADGDKCPRCWQWEVTAHEHKLCSRCQRVLA